MRRRRTAGRIALAAALVAAAAGAARADEDDAAPAATDSTESAERAVIQTYYPPPVDGPALRLPESPTRLYVDAAYSDSKDLSALPYIAGSGTNFRFALGGVWRWRRFSFEAEIPFANVTSLDVTHGAGRRADARKADRAPRSVTSAWARSGRRGWPARR